MLPYCLKFEKIEKVKIQKFNRQKFEVCDSKKLKFIKEQETSGLLSSFEIKTPLSSIPLLGPLLKSIKQVTSRYKINEIAN